MDNLTRLIVKSDFFDTSYIPTDKKIIIYGVSSFAKIYYDIFSQKGIMVSCFAVSDGYKNQESFCDLPVYCLSEIPYEKEKVFFAVVTHEMYHETINKNIEKYDNKTFISYSSYLALLKDIFIDWLGKKNIDVTKATLKIADWEIKNPLVNCNEQVIGMFCSEVGDCVLPSILPDEYSFCSEGPYECEEVTFNKGDVVFDVGANMGLVSSVAASKGCKVYAFEPIFNTLELLRAICFKYMHNITPVQVALSDKIGIESFIDFNNSTSMTKLNGSVSGNKSRVDIMCTTIDQFVSENKITKLDFIKADIEGAERLMLAGARSTLSTLEPKISICTYHLPDDPEVLERLIKEANPKYVVTHRWKKLYAYVPKV